ncbi:MAG: dTMP kinase [Candidatus Hadarchaeota archaeon]
MKGKFITIEGIDGCGKSTQTRLLCRWLKSTGRNALVTDEPTNGKMGRIIKSILKGKLKVPIEVEALLFAADRAQHVSGLISPAVRDGWVVINERYIYSSRAYQLSRGVSEDFLVKINSYVPKPDLAILIDISAEAALARIKPSRNLDEFEKDLRLQESVRRNYLRMAEAGELKVVDGERSRDEVQAEIRKLVGAIL